MLQQTQVDTVIPYYRRFLRRFPTLRRLANTSLPDVLKVWEGLGYYRRARLLHEAARQVLSCLGGHMPRTATDWRALPGVGDYTAAAIASICFNEPVPVVDGNVLRVWARLAGSSLDIAKPSARRAAHDFLTPLMAGTHPGDFNQALMELGALVCRPRAPACARCPLQPHCAAFRTGRTGRLPVKTRAGPVPSVEVAVGLVRRAGRILIARRPARAMLGGLWEFPGGKRRPGEPLAETVRREVREETGLDVIVGEKRAVIRHTYSHFRLILHAFDCRAKPGRARPLAADAVRWAPPARLADYPFPRANRRLLETLAR
jgi:A/G-specific adenine glycosylase